MNTEKNAPKFKTNADGSVDVPLRRPIKVSGVEVKALRMREPTVEDQLANEAVAGTDAQKELAFMSNLCMVAPDELRKLTLRDYKACQEAMVSFLD